MDKQRLSPIAQELVEGKTIEGSFTPQALAQKLGQIQAQEQGSKHIQLKLIDFLIKWIFVLQEELKPGKELQVKLHLGQIKPKEFPVKIEKNYKRLTHRYIIWGYWLFNLFLGLFLIFGVTYGKNYIDLFKMFSLIVVPIYLLLGYMATLYFAENAFGDIDPKIKSRIRQVPRIVIKTQLADGTQFELNVSHYVIRKTVIKDRFYKTLGSTRTKRKRKAKTVTTIKLGFPKKIYSVSETDFAQRFRYLLRLGEVKIAKMKLKTGGKRNVVIYQDVRGEEGTIAPPVDFDRTLQIVTIGGYRRLYQGLPEDYWWEDLTQIEQVNQEIEGAFNKVGVYTFQQLMVQEEYKFGAKVMELTNHRLGESYFNYRIKEWQTKAQSILQAQGEDLSRIEGVGDTYLEKLHKAGIYTFQKLIDTKGDELSAIVEELNVSVKKVEYWKKQAEELMSLNKDS